MLFADLNMLLGELQLYLFIAFLLFVHWLYIYVNTYDVRDRLLQAAHVDLFGLFILTSVIIAVWRLRNVIVNILETGNKSHCVLW